MNANNYSTEVSGMLLNNPSPYHYSGGGTSGINYGFCCYEATAYGTEHIAKRFNFGSTLKHAAQQYRAHVEAQTDCRPVLLVTGNVRFERKRFVDALVHRLGHEGAYHFTGNEVAAHMPEVSQLLAEPMGMMVFSSLDTQTLLLLLTMLPKRNKANTVIISVASIDIIPKQVTQHIDLDEDRRKGEPLIKLARSAKSEGRV